MITISINNRQVGNNFHEVLMDGLPYTLNQQDGPDQTLFVLENGEVEYTQELSGDISKEFVSGVLARSKVKYTTQELRNLFSELENKAIDTSSSESVKTAVQKLNDVKVIIDPVFESVLDTLVLENIITEDRKPSILKGVEQSQYVPVVSVLSKLEFMNRFTDAELEAIYAAAKQNVSVEIWLEKFKLTTDINLRDQRTIDGIQMLEQAGLLTEGRSAEILTC